MKLSPYSIHVSWDARAETPEALAERFRSLLARLEPLHPALSNWRWLHRDASLEPFATANRDLAGAIAAKVFRDEWDEIEVASGYALSVLNSETDEARAVSLGVQAGKIFRLPGVNGADLATAYKLAPAPTLVAYDVFKPALLAFAESHEADWGSAYPVDLMGLWLPNQRYRLAWMSYVKPEWAPLITPPATALVERRPNGGLFMAATDETFRMQNPAHLAVARHIVAALAPLEAMTEGREQALCQGNAT